MIKFFRKIRYDLMEKDSTSKYLKYAIGEIVLVVFGILIALQINNWNENRVAQKRIDSRLVNLTQDIKSDIAEMNDILKMSKDRIIVIKSVLKGSNRLGSFGIFEEPFFEHNTKAYQNPNLILSMLRTLDGDGPTFKELINSGEFYLIKNTLIAYKIQKYYSTVDEIKDREYWNNHQSHTNIIKSKARLGLGTGSRDGTIEKLIEMAKNDNQFGAELEHEHTVSIQQYNVITRLKLQAQDLIEAIESRKSNK